MRTSNKNRSKSLKKDKTLKEEKNVPLSPYSRLDTHLIEEFDKFVDCVPSARLSRQLRNMFILYISCEHEMLPANFKEFVDDFYFLLNFLDAIGKELPDSVY